MSGHTPGPWAVRTNGSGVSYTVITTAGRKMHGGGDAICTCRPANRTDDAYDEADYNARLVAAAPDLLAAAWDARSALDALMGDSDLDGDYSAEFRACQALSAAIAKATS